MAKEFRITDFFQIKPDVKLAKLSKSEKHELMDSVLNTEDSMYSNQPKGLVVDFNLSHGGRKINNRIYPPLAQRDGVSSWTEPFAKPILLNHDMHCDPLGRFQSVEWVSLDNEAIKFFDSAASYAELKQAMDQRKVRKMYDLMRRNNLLKNDRWPGFSKLLASASITDEKAVERFLDGRYLTFSAGSHTDAYTCALCEADWHNDDVCEHRPGVMSEDGEMPLFVTGTFFGREGSVVNGPADSLGYVEEIRTMDSNDETIAAAINASGDWKHKSSEMIISDSVVSVIADKYSFPVHSDSSEVIDGTPPVQEEKEKEEEVQVDKKHDHTLSISNKEMEELHAKGETMVTTSSGSETMVIKVMWEGFKSEEDSMDSVDEDILSDEKKFKVPAGARGNARKVLEWKKKYGNEVKGMTPVGWARARQLAGQSEIPLSTVKRMAAFNRHRKNAAVDPKFKDTPWKDRGYVAWLGWGGTTGVDWAIKISAANDSETEAIVTEDKKKTGASTPAKPSERIKGSKKNKEGSAAKANRNIAVGSVLESLKEKVASHNKKHGDKKGKRVTLGMLKAVYRRGAGAFSTSHRPGMSRSGWGVARVNAFLHLVRTGSPKNSAYKQDNDLLPKGHPKKS